MWWYGGVVIGLTSTVKNNLERERERERETKNDCSLCVGFMRSMEGQEY